MAENCYDDATTLFPSEVGYGKVGNRWQSCRFYDV